MIFTHYVYNSIAKYSCKQTFIITVWLLKNIIAWKTEKKNKFNKLTTWIIFIMGFKFLHQGDT